MEFNEDDLKLIYVLKIGYNSNDEGLYEFIFAEDEENIDVEKWCWDLSPACDNAMPPEKEFISKIYNLKTKSFDLFCLHESVEREYMHGYHTIHALAYETEKINDDTTDFSSYESMFEKNGDDDAPLLVFHYGITLLKIKDLLNTRKIILKDNEFIEISSVEL